MMDEFAVLILTHGRPDNIKTIPTLKAGGYTGKIYLVVDDLDKTGPEYIKKYGSDMVRIFDKKLMATKTDNGDNFNKLTTITHARNASFEIAEEIGLKYFVQLDDDYTNFSYRFNDKGEYEPKTIRNLDFVFTELLTFLVSTSFSSIALSQGGDFIGGPAGSFAKSIRTKRKCMNSFFCMVDRPFKFLGTMNEDVNTYTSRAVKGMLFLTINQVSLTQIATQSSAGGITELYKDAGTYVKSFYTIMFQPSSVKINEMGNSKETKRLHHTIDWKTTVPMIVDEKYRKVKRRK